MKAVYILLTPVLMLALIGEVYGQNKTDSIYWDNGNISLLSDLGRVHIIKKKGDNIREARIFEIKKEKGVLVYEKDKCLHDVAISNIENIQPGYNPMAILVFQIDNTPYIKELSGRYDSFNEPTTFKVISKKQKPSPPARVIPVAAEKTIIDTAVTLQNDVLIDLDGNVWDIKILIMQDNLVEFKKTNNLDGPVYVKTFLKAEFTKREDYTIIKILK